MSLLKMIRAQFGQSATPANNYVMRALDDGKLRMSRGNAGAESADVLVANADNTLDVLASPAQFANSKKLATMEAVQRALGNYQSCVLSSGGAINITAAQAGGAWDIFGTATVTIPLASSVPVGTTLTFSVGAGVTINCSGADNLYNNWGMATAASWTPPAGSSFRLVTISSTQWLIFSEGIAGFVKGSNGYQRLPSGVIIQWCTLVSNASGLAAGSWPIAFPTGVFQMVANYLLSGNALGVVGMVSSSTNATTVQANVFNSTNAAPVNGGQVCVIGVGH